MTETDINTLKSNIDRRVKIKTIDGDYLVAKILSVFAEESDADMFFELVSTSRPELYKRTGQVGGYSIPLNDIVSVSAED
jgi:hypothetical protein